MTKLGTYFSNRRAMIAGVVSISLLLGLLWLGVKVWLMIFFGDKLPDELPSWHVWLMVIVILGPIYFLTQAVERWIDPPPDPWAEEAAIEAEEEREEEEHKEEERVRRAAMKKRYPTKADYKAATIQAKQAVATLLRDDDRWDASMRWHFAEVALIKAAFDETTVEQAAKDWLKANNILKTTDETDSRQKQTPPPI